MTRDSSSMQASAVRRLQNVASAFSSSPPEPAFANPNRSRFQPCPPKNAPVHITPLNPVSFLLRAASIRPDRVAIKHPGINAQWTYAEWAMRVCALAYGLKRRGIKRGDRVCVISPNVPLILDLLQAVPAIHATIVPMNIRLTKPEAQYILEHSGSKIVLADHEFAQLASGFNGEVIVSKDTGGRDPADAYEQLIESGRADAETLGWAGLEFIDDEDANFAICYTSGTTGRPKGVVTTFRGTYLAGLNNAIESGMTTQSNYLWILPAFHANGWCFPFAIPAVTAGQVCLRSVGDYSPVWDAFRNHGVTTYCAAPTVQIGIINHPSAEKLPQQVVTFIAGAAPSASLINTLEKLHIHVIHVYGLTETYGPVTCYQERDEWKDNSETEKYKRKAMQGYAYISSDEARVVRTDSSAADGYEDVNPDGKEVGEIVIRGNLTMKEYYKNPEETAKAFEGGFFHTGDLAVRQPYGMISIQDRSKDIIISGGENASSLSIESALYEHPDVLEVAVVARPHDKYGERAHAFVILRDAAKWDGKPAEFEVELKEFSRPRLPGFARPEWVEVVPALPKTSTGKIQKHELRKKFKSIIPGQ